MYISFITNECFILLDGKRNKIKKETDFGEYANRITRDVLL